MLRSCALCAIMYVTTHALPAQIVRGQAVDSISGMALQGATLALIDQTDSVVGRTRTDPNGLFLLRSTNPGLFRLRVTLDGYRPSIFPAFDLAPDTVVAFRLLVAPLTTEPPLSQSELLATLCPPDTPAGHALVFGFVTDAETGLPVANAEVAMRLPPLRGDVAPVETMSDLELSVSTSDDGFYAMCGIPALARVGLWAADGARRSDFARVVFTAGGVVEGATFQAMNTRIWRHDLTIRAAPLQSAAIQGIVTDGTGAPLAGVEVTVSGTERTARTDEDGGFRLTGLPGGWTRLELRLAGFEPMRREVELVRDETVDLPAPFLALEPASVRLADITVEGASPFWTPRKLAGFLRRREGGSGTYIVMDEFVQRWGRPIRPSDVFRNVESIRVHPSGGITAPRCITLRQAPYPAVYVDGMFLGTTDNTEIDRLMSVNHIEAIEIYHGGSTTPPEFNRLGTACGAIVIWTK